MYGFHIDDTSSFSRRISRRSTQDISSQPPAFTLIYLLQKAATEVAAAAFGFSHCMFISSALSEATPAWLAACIAATLSFDAGAISPPFSNISLIRRCFHYAEAASILILILRRLRLRCDQRHCFRRSFALRRCRVTLQAEGHYGRILIFEGISSPPLPRRQMFSRR
jgi:hypothetical protein